MSDGFLTFLLFCVVLMTAGFVAGIKAEAHRWRTNADRIQRIESAGQLFKVHHDDPKDHP